MPATASCCEPVAEDAPGVLAVHGDPRVYELDPHEAQRDLADAERFLAPILRHWDEWGFGYWTVLVDRELWPDGIPGPLRDDGARVNVGLGGVQRYTLAGALVLNVYFRLAPAVHSHGIAGRIVQAALVLAPGLAPGADVVARTRPAVWNRVRPTCSCSAAHSRARCGCDRRRTWTCPNS